MQPEWNGWLERLCNLRRDKRGSHERPHKPVLLLSIMDLLDRDLIGENKVVLSEELVRTFKRYIRPSRFTFPCGGSPGNYGLTAR